MRLLLWVAAKALGLDKPPRDIHPPLPRIVPPSPLRAGRRAPQPGRAVTPPPASRQFPPAAPTRFGMATYPGTEPTAVWFPDPGPAPRRIEVKPAGDV